MLSESLAATNRLVGRTVTRGNGVEPQLAAERDADATLSGT